MKVLVVITTDFVSWGGLTSVIMNYYRAMDRTNIIDYTSVKVVLHTSKDDF